MKDKKTVFILGAGASCPYGYPSGKNLRELICLSLGQKNTEVLEKVLDSKNDLNCFIETFEKSCTESIDLFMARNPKLAKIGKCIIAFEIYNVENRSKFRERAMLQRDENKIFPIHNVLSGYLRRKEFKGDDWYSYLFKRLTEGFIDPNNLPDFSDNKPSFITFNYDRSLEYFLYESIHNSFTEVSEEKIVQSLKQLKILHVYGQIAPLKWQNPDDYIDYKPRTDESLLQRAANNIRTIYEEKQNPELIEAQNLLKQAKQIFFLGFGYAPENMEVLGLPALIAQDCWVYGTAFGANEKEVKRIRNRVIEGLRADPPNIKSEFRIVIEPVDCLEILRNYWE